MRREEEGLIGGGLTPRRRAAMFFALGVLSAGSAGGIELDREKDALRAFLVGNHVVAKIDMPATKKGLDIHPRKPVNLDYDQHLQRLRDFGVSIEEGTRVRITKVKIKGKHIEVHFDGGGHSGGVPLVDDSDVSRLKFAIFKEDDDEKRVKLEAELREAQKALKKREKQAVEEARQEALGFGSRINIRWDKDITAVELSPEAVARVLDEFVELSGDLAAAIRPPTNAVPSSGRGAEIVDGDIEEPGPGTRYAVIIGISRYRDSRIPTLAFTGNDAQGMYDLLTDPEVGGFDTEHVKLLLDDQATTRNVKSAIGTWLASQARRNDTVVIYYAGHGAPEKEQTYWVTHDADIDDLYSSALSNDEVAGMLERVRSRQIVSFIDSCYSAATIHRSVRTRDLLTGDPFEKFKGKGRVTITASDGKQQSIELREFRHGVFTYFLLQGLRGDADEDGDGVILLGELWDHVKFRVEEVARENMRVQTPTFDGNLTAGIVLASPGRD